MQTRMACKKHTDSAYFRKAITVRPDKTIANIAITLNRQTDSLLRKLIDHLKTEFLTHGGIKKRCMRHAKNGTDRTNNKPTKNAEPALSASSAPYLISLIFNNLQVA